MDKCRCNSDILEEFRQIVLKLVTKIVIPILPFYIAPDILCTFIRGYDYQTTAGISSSGSDCNTGTLSVWLALLYAIGGLYSGGNPLQVVNYGPAYPIFYFSVISRKTT